MRWLHLFFVRSAMLRGAQHALAAAGLIAGALALPSGALAQADECNGLIAIAYVSGPAYAIAGDTYRIRVMPGTDTIVGGTNDELTVDQFRFALDCSGGGNLPCTDEGDIIRYVNDSTITSSGCVDSNALAVTWSSNGVDSAAGPFTNFSNCGNEIAFGTIGNASTSEGVFWEAVNAIGVFKSPVIITIYDDGYGISVTNEHQMVKQNLSELLQGFQRSPGSRDGYDIYTVRGWDYPALLETYRKAAQTARQEHIPAIIHVIELTQPQGHSTSGSHERYKSKERLHWEEEFDCLQKLRQWIIDQGIISPDELDKIEKADRNEVEEIRKQAWQAYISPIQKETRGAAKIIDQLISTSTHAEDLIQIKNRLVNNPNPVRRDIQTAIREILTLVRGEHLPAIQDLKKWRQEQEPVNASRYGSHLYSQSDQSALLVTGTKQMFSPTSPRLYGFEIINACFDAALKRDPRVFAFGEDLGRLGDVIQGFRGLQEKYGELRVSDTGIREATIVGQAIGMAMRGLRPIAEIQYLDYLLYGLQILSDDLASLLWRTKGGQKAPVIVRTRGHRLEGIFEAILERHPAIQQAVVTASQWGSEHTQLTAHLVTRFVAFDEHSLRLYLKSHLPDHMLPKAFCVHQDFPLTPSGKIDRLKLSQEGYQSISSQKSIVNPGTETEKKLVELWERSLKTRPIGNQDDFFELGGNSLLAAQLFHQIENVFGRKLPLASLFKAPTIELQAAILQDKDLSMAWSSLYQAHIMAGGLLTDELEDTQLGAAQWDYDRRTFSAQLGNVYAESGCDSTQSFGIYRPVQTARYQADVALATIKGFTDA